MSSRDYAELIAMSRLEAVGSDRRDLGLLKVAMNLLRALGVTGSIDPNNLLPIEIPKHEMSDQEQYAALLAFSRQHNGKVNRNPESLPDAG